MEKPKIRNPFDLITEDQEVGQRIPIGTKRDKSKRVKIKPMQLTYSGVNGDELNIKF